MVLSTNQAAVGNVQVDLKMQFGAHVKSDNSLLITFSDEILRQDKSTITCFFALGSSIEVEKNCAITASLTNVVMSIEVDNFCQTTCDPTTVYTLRLKGAVNKLNSDPYQGTVLI